MDFCRFDKIRKNSSKDFCAFVLNKEQVKIFFGGLSMKKVLFLGSVIIGLVSATPAFAVHDHYLNTPGTCVEDIAKGQTSKLAGEGGFHKYHVNVHLGIPGTYAFQKSGKVEVSKFNICEQE